MCVVLNQLTTLRVYSRASPGAELVSAKYNPSLH